MTTRPLDRASVPDPPPAVRLRDPAGVVAAVPYLLGFVPRRSLVVVGIDDHACVGPTLRCDHDLGAAEPGADASPVRPQTPLPLLWDHVVTVMARNGCHTLLVVAYTDADPGELEPARTAGLLAVVLPATDHGSSPQVLDVLAVGPTRYRSMACAEDGCCPVEGLPLAGVDAHPVAAEFVLAGRSPAPDRESLEPPVTVQAQDRRAALTAVVRARRATEARGVAGPDRTSQAVRDEHLLHRWADSLPLGPSPRLAGELVVAWRGRPGLRDACLTVLLTGGTELADSVLGTSHGPAARDLHEVLGDPGAAGAARAGGVVLRRLAALVDGPERATVLAAHAWLSWVAGDGTAAGVLAERALELDRAQSMALLVQQCLGHGLGAPWTAGSRPDVPW